MLKYKKMIQTRINHADISWEEFPILAFNPDLNVIIIALENGDYLKGTVVNSDTQNIQLGNTTNIGKNPNFALLKMK